MINVVDCALVPVPAPAVADTLAVVDVDTDVGIDTEEMLVEDVESDKDEDELVAKEVGNSGVVVALEMDGKELDVSREDVGEKDERVDDAVVIGTVSRGMVELVVCITESELDIGDDDTTLVTDPRDDVDLVIVLADSTEKGDANEDVEPRTTPCVDDDMDCIENDVDCVKDEEDNDVEVVVKSRPEETEVAATLTDAPALSESDASAPADVDTETSDCTVELVVGEV